MNPFFCANLIQHLPIGLIVWQLDAIEELQIFRIVEMNSIARQILEIPSDQLLKDIDDPFPAFLKVEPPDVYAKVLQTQRVQPLGDIRYRTQPGTETIFAVQLFPLPDRQLGAMIEDVTDRCHAEEELQRSKQKLLFHLQRTPMAVIEWDLNRTVVDWNPAAEKMFGYNKSEILGEPLDLIVPDEQKEQGDRIWDTLVQSKGSTQNTSDNLTKDGRRITCEWYDTPLMDEDGNVVGVASLAQDVSERLQFEAAMTASEMRYRRLFEAAQDGIMILNADTGQILNVNSALTHLLGYSKAELLDKRCWDLGFPEDRTASFLAFQTVQREGSIRYEDLPVRTKDGHQIDVEFVSNMYFVDGQRVIQCNIRDISQRKRLEEELQDFNTRLERSNRELQDFAFVASHDLQEPLRKIQAFGDRLRQKYYDALGNEGQDYLQRMQSAAKRMQILINDLLAFSRITTKAQPFVKTSLEAIVQDVLSDLEIHIQQVGGRVEIANLPLLEADPMQMRQLFQNLISNALKFHQPGVAPLIQINASSPDANARGVQITVADNGIGFDEKYLDRIFTVFQRLHGRNEYEGTGVGLAICRKIVEQHGGTITARSTPGQGATFVITLPLGQPARRNEF